MLLRIAMLALLLSSASAGAAEAGPPVAQMQRAADAALQGHLSLARSLLEPVLVSPRTPSALRARAYHYRGLFFYREGLLVSAQQDFRRALEFDPVYADARNALAWLHLQGYGVPRDARRAVALYRLAARQGHAEAQLNLALLLMRGQGSRQRPAEALHWFQRAGDQGETEGAAQAGLLLARGAPSAGVVADAAAALPWLRQAAEVGHARAQMVLGRLLADPATPHHAPAAALRWLEAAADTGMPAAYSQLGRVYQAGQGVDRDLGKALMFFREGAKLGDPAAQSHVGYFYDAGLAVAEDDLAAERWYRRAAERGEATAQRNLAQLYQQGGRPGAPGRDAAKARYWLEQAAAGGDARAQAALAWLLATAPEDEVRDGSRAMDLAQTLVQAEPEAAHLDTLAAAYAEVGRFAAAVDTQLQAIDHIDTALETSTFDADGRARLVGLRNAYAQRLDHYRDDQPWRAQP